MFGIVQLKVQLKIPQNLLRMAITNSNKRSSKKWFISNRGTSLLKYHTFRYINVYICLIFLKVARQVLAWTRANFSKLYLAIVKNPNTATVMGYYHWLKVHNSKNTRLRTWFLRWLSGLLQGQYLPSFIIKYVPVNKDFSEKIATTAVLDNLFWSGLQNDIGAATATKWRHYLFYLQPYFSALGTALPKSLKEAFPPIAASMFVKFKWNSAIRALSRYFAMRFLLLEIR